MSFCLQGSLHSPENELPSSGAITTSTVCSLHQLFTEHYSHGTVQLISFLAIIFWPANKPSYCTFMLRRHAGTVVFAYGQSMPYKCIGICITKHNKNTTRWVLVG